MFPQFHVDSPGPAPYAIVTGHSDDGVQLIDVSDPTNPVAVGSATDGVNGFDVLGGAAGGRLSDG